MPEESQQTAERAPFSMATVSLVVARLTDGEDVQNDDLYRYARENSGRIRALIQAEMMRKLGEQYRIGEFRVESGSAAILFDVHALAGHLKEFAENGFVLAGVTFAAIDGFLNTMDRFVSGCTTVLRAFFQKAPAPKIGVAPLIVQPSWHLSSALLVAVGIASSGKSGTDTLLVRYLIISHAALLVFIVWLVVRHMQ
jgi:hypothetical protein